MNRREFIRNSSILAVGLNAGSFGQAAEHKFPLVRTAPAKRKFRSDAVERTIERVTSSVGDKELGWMFANCFPNTLDTTVDFEMIDGRPDTYVITGDIDAMWLRDSSAQVWPYLQLMREDPQLQLLIAGVINRQTRCILKDPYANAFYKDEQRVSPWKDDLTEMRPGIHERKWEVDSLCHPIRLGYHYWKASNDTTPFDAAWNEATALIVRTFREQQRKEDRGPYSFMRRTEFQNDTLSGKGYGNPARPVGLIHSMFRPSDDATILPLLVPANFFAVVSLRQAAEMVEQIAHDIGLAKQCRSLADEIELALEKHAILDHPLAGRIYAYEVDGYGNGYCIDDSNIPSLLSLPYLGVISAGDSIYESTRAFLLSQQNPYYFHGKAAEGPGGPHVGMDMIWPLGIIARGLTSADDHEIRECLMTLRRTHAGTGFMHEAFDKDNPENFTRPWFAWANTLFGEFVLKIFRERPQLLN
jgi:hypothetical protein